MLQGVFNNADGLAVMILWHAIPGAMLPVGARPHMCLDFSCRHLRAYPRFVLVHSVAHSELASSWLRWTRLAPNICLLYHAIKPTCTKLRRLLSLSSLLTFEKLDERSWLVTRIGRQGLSLLGRMVVVRTMSWPSRHISLQPIGKGVTSIAASPTL